MLQKLCICMSHKSVIRLHEAMGKDHDKAVHEWKSTFLPSLASNNQVTIIHIIST